jgi:hypothetical protein
VDASAVYCRHGVRTEMADEVLVYVSAAPDLQREREILSRAVTEVPVPLGWRVVQSPMVIWQILSEMSMSDRSTDTGALSSSRCQASLRPFTIEESRQTSPMAWATQRWASP